MTYFPMYKNYTDGGFVANDITLVVLKYLFKKSKIVALSIIDLSTHMKVTLKNYLRKNLFFF